MPELPEVETVCRSLAPFIVGKRVSECLIGEEKLIKSSKGDEFINKIIGRTFTAIKRKGKYILLLLDDGETLVVHLRMTGKLLISLKDEPVNKHTHVRFSFEDCEQELRYEDIRKFGILYLGDEAKLAQLKGLVNLGYEPLSEEFTTEVLKEILHSSNKKIKAVLLDQTKIAGIGNIYADEILFQAKIHPESIAKNITDEEVIEALHFAIQDRLREGIKYGGSSIKDYVNSFGEAGSFQKLHKVYAKAGERCVECGGILDKMTSAGRSSTYCPNCQIKY